MIMDIQNVINEAQELILENKNEWETRYKNYAAAILFNEETINSNVKRFNEFSPLRFYITTTSATAFDNTLTLDIRYRGQSVANLKVNKDNIIITTKGKSPNNLRDFDCAIELNDVDWNSPEARSFRSFFKNREDSRNKKNNKGNEEHNVESLLLDEFEKKDSINKPILDIQPIKIGNVRFSMPTPISASNHKEPLKYSREKGGCIDIFARMKRGPHSVLTVIEVKDENKSSEPPKYALKQAIQYAIFVRELLRSESGADWYKIFGIGKELNDRLKIRVACAMPDDKPDVTFAGNEYYIEEDIIECHYIYFKYDGKQLSDIQCSFK